MKLLIEFNPALWMQDVLGIPPHDWQKTFLFAPQGASIAVLTARQVGKTTAAAVGMAPTPYVKRHKNDATDAEAICEMRASDRDLIRGGHYGQWWPSVPH